MTGSLSQTASPVLTIGHSTRTLEFFIRMLKAHEVTKVVDIRTVPHSRHNPQFNKETLPDELKAAGIEYKPFRGFADYMQTEEFEENLKTLINISGQGRIALMCAEAVLWRCHRSLIADTLVIRGIKVVHIMSLSRIQPHKLTPFALVKDLRITYPSGNSGPAESPAYTLFSHPY